MLKEPKERTPRQRLKLYEEWVTLPENRREDFLCQHEITEEEIEEWQRRMLAGLEGANGHPSPGEVTRLIDAWSGGDPEALDRLMPLVYKELHEIASRCFGKEAINHTLQTTALVSEAYLKFKEERQVHWRSKRGFYAAAASKIRRILIDHARKRGALKRGGDVLIVSLDDAIGIPDDKNPGLMVLNDALERLAELSPRQSHFLELRIFGGFTVSEIVEMENVGRGTVYRDWNAAVSWLRRELSPR